MKNRRYIFLSILFGFISTLLTYIGYGVSDHSEQLPIIFRVFDASFLSNDFFTNVNANSIARIHYSKILAFLSGSEENLPSVFMLLTYAANISISVITFYFGRMIFHRSDRAGIAASAMVMVIPTFELGYFDVIYSKLLTPSAIATPMALGAILSVFQGNLLIGAILCCVTAFIQPLIGLEMAALLIFTYALCHFSKREIWKILLSLIILAVTFLYFAVPLLTQKKINTDTFAYIIAHFRHPHHYLPSTFHVLDYAKALVFLTAILLIAHRLIRVQNPFGKYSAILIYSTIAVCVGGYVFVELIPLRLWITAQVFRLLFFVKWLGLVLFAGMLVEKNRYVYVAGIVLLALLFISQSISATSAALFVCFLISIYLIDIVSFKIFATGSLSVLLLLLGVVFTREYIPGIRELGSLKRLRNNMRLNYNDETYQGRSDVDEYARLHTPEYAVFLTPPNWGEFRFLAKRAIVVDFKAFPFSDLAMKEWFDRMLDCYGSPANHGFAMISELNRKYRDINDNRLKSLQQKYGISYAVLYQQTATNFETVYSGKEFKIVSLK